MDDPTNPVAGDHRTDGGGNAGRDDAVEDARSEDGESNENEGGHDVYCPLATPFDADGSLDADSLQALVAHLVSVGIDGLVPCGTTGEFAALTDDERRTVVETVVRTADGRVPVVAGVGGTAVGAVRERMGHANAVGADAAIVVVPYFGGQATPSGNEAFYRSVLADAPLPVYLYDIPSATGQRLRPETVATLSQMSSLVGIKDSTGDLTAFDEVLIETPDDFVVFQGWDAQFVPGLAMGADGGINALAHVFPDAFAAASAALARRDVEAARRVQLETIDPGFRQCLEHGFAPAMKALLEHRDVIDSAAVRPPLEPVSDADREDLFEAVDVADS